jgi:hypothetical protein
MIADFRLQVIRYACLFANLKSGNLNLKSNKSGR